MPVLMKQEVLSDEVWMPDDVIRALGCPFIPVEFYDGESEARFFEDCQSSHLIGLTHIRLTKAKDILFCLTLADKIIVLDMTISRHVDLLTMLLSESKLEFCTIKGHYLANALKMEFHIHLEKIRDFELTTFDLTTFDVFLSMREIALNGVLAGRDTSVKSFHEISADIRYRDREDLFKHWLDVIIEGGIEQMKAETKVLIEQPRSVAAQNVIRKRSCLIRALSLEMRQKFDALIFQDSNNLYKFANEVRDQRFIEYENLGDDSYSTVIDFMRKQ